MTDPRAPDPNEILPGVLDELRRQARIWKRVLGRAVQPPSIPGEEGQDAGSRPAGDDAGGPSGGAGKVLPDQSDGR